MRKLIAGVVILIVLIGIGVYESNNNSVQTSDTSALTWEETLVATATRSERLADTLTLQSVTVPIPYGTVKHLGDNASMAVGYSEVVKITKTIPFETYFRMYNFSETEKQATCNFLSRTASEPICESNYQLYKAFLELKATDITLFSSETQKALYRKLMSMRGDLLPSQTVAPLDVHLSNGFLFTVDPNDFVAILFDSQDEPYEIHYSGISEPDVIFSLSNLEVQ